MKRLKLRLLALAMFALFGAFIMGSGPLTAHVVSQSCCFPDASGLGCAPENACSAQLQHAAMSDLSAVAMGLSLVFLSLVLVVGEILLDRQHREARIRRSGHRPIRLA